MVWGSFGVVHIASLIFSVCIIVGLYFLLKKLPGRGQIAILGILSFSGMGAIVFNLVVWGSPLEYLPLHLCSLNAIVLPVAVFTRSKVLNNLLLLWSLGALCALVVNTAQADFEILSWTFFFYYFPHTLECGIPILMFLLKHVEKDVRCILSTLAITLVSYVVVHFINLGVNAYCVNNNILDLSGELIQVNYMYSLVPANPVLQMLWDILPYSFWYMMLTIPLVVVYLGGVYCPNIVRAIKT